MLVLGRLWLQLTCLLMLLARTSLTSTEKVGDDEMLYDLVSRWQHWEEVVPRNAVSPSNFSVLGRPSFSMVSVPVYVSLTSVSFRIETLAGTLRTILDGIVVPTHIYVFLSKQPHLLDEGVTRIPEELLRLVAQKLITIVFTDNIGPHRKLIPILHRFYDEDVLIVNIDDDMVHQPQSTLLYQLLRYYKESDGQSVVALRSRRIGFCQEHTPQADNQTLPSSKQRVDMFAPYVHWDVHYVEGSREMFVLPTGTGGVLYRPRFFHPIVFDPDFRAVTGTADDLMFRLACMATNTSVLVACRDLEQNNRIVRRCPVDSSFLPPGSSPQALGAQRALSTLLNATALTPEKKHSQDSGRRQLRPSLYKLNAAGLNDAQWRNAVRFLQERRLLNMTQLFQEHHREREAACYPKIEPVLNGTTNSSTNSTINSSTNSTSHVIGRVPKGCSIVRCAGGKPKSTRRARKQHGS
jgi:hypothetical protein